MGVYLDRYMENKGIENKQYQLERTIIFIQYEQ